jgi:pimeloyl-ACP methyl ester carboxylesterase
MKTLVLAATVLICSAFGLAMQGSHDLPRTMDDGEGHLIRARVEGTGSPAVVMEIGLGGPCEEWSMVQPEVAKFALTFSYDRGTSDRKEAVLAGRQIAVELHNALANAHIPPPYVLVGQSFAGVYNRIFAAMYPNEVAGMVLLDPTTKVFADWLDAHHPEQSMRNEHVKDAPMMSGISQTFEELDALGPPPDVPVIVVTGSKHQPSKLFDEIFPVWLKGHEDLAKSFPQGRHVVTEKSGHGVQIDQPDLVVELIREVVEETRR